WDSGRRVAFVGQFLETITRAGYNWFSIDYRLGGVRNYKNALDDLRAATDFIRCHAKEFRINPENIALFGEDAGAHLAAMFAIEKPAGVKAAVLLGGFYDLREIPGLKSSSSPESLAQATPITQIVSGMPDVLIAHGAADTESRIDTTKRYCFEVTKAGGRCDFLSVEGGIHRPENWRPEQWTYKERMTKWLGRKLKLSAPDFEPHYSGLRKDIQFIGYEREDGKIRNLKLDLYRPSGNGPFPTVIIANAGGWEAANTVTDGNPLVWTLVVSGLP